MVVFVKLEVMFFWLGFLCVKELLNIDIILFVIDLEFIVRLLRILFWLGCCILLILIIVFVKFLFVYDFLILGMFLCDVRGFVYFCVIVLEWDDVFFGLLNIVMILFVMDLVIIVVLLIILFWLVCFLEL